jgi:hypothetical protein
MHAFALRKAAGELWVFTSSQSSLAHGVKEGVYEV